MSIQKPVQVSVSGRNFRVLALSLAALFGIGLLGSSSRGARRQVAVSSRAGSSAPLAFVRVLAVETPRIAVAPDSQLKPRPASTDKKALSGWQRMKADRRALVSLHQSAREQLSLALTGRLGTISGLTVLTDSELTQAGPSPDATLRVSIDRVGAHTGAAREVWLRAAVRLETTGRKFGPFYAIGQAASPKWLIKPGYVWSDQEIMSEAARQAARQLVHSLKTGVEPIFVRATRVAVIPARTPASVEKVFEGKEDKTTVDAALLWRLADVLFQPGLTPVVERVSADEIERAQKKLGTTGEQLWAAGNKPHIQKVAELGAVLKVDFVFLSRIGDMLLEQKPAVIHQFGNTRDGNEIRAEVDLTGWFVRVSDSSILWSDRVTGTSVARTQFTRHGPRIRRDEQCLADAARVGYAWLRSSFENYKRQFEK